VIFRRPKAIQTPNLKTILAEDDVDALLIWISSTSRVGKMIGDLFLAYEKDYLRDWTDLKTADEQVPYEHSVKNQKQIGYRLWWLSRANTDINVRRRVYHGCWLDKMVQLSGGRAHIKFIKVSVEAVKCFETRREIFEELYK